MTKKANSDVTQGGIIQEPKIFQEGASEYEKNNSHRDVGVGGGVAGLLSAFLVPLYLAPKEDTGSRGRWATVY